MIKWMNKPDHAVQCDLCTWIAHTINGPRFFGVMYIDALVFAILLMNAWFLCLFMSKRVPYSETTLYPYFYNKKTTFININELLASKNNITY